MDDNKHNQSLNAGETGFTVVLLLAGLFFTWQSVLLYRQAPGASSYGAVPLFCSVLIVIFALAILLEDRKKKTPISGQSIGRAIKAAFTDILPKDMLVIIALGVLYCVAMYLNLGFMVTTPVFLWCSMTYLSRGNYLKNLLWTALCMIFIYLVFRVLFSVVLP